DFAALKRYLWEFLDVKEIIALKIRIAIIVCGRNAGGLDCAGKSGLCDIFRIVLDRGLKIPEISMNMTDHHVFDCECNAAVLRIDNISISRISENACERKYKCKQNR